MALVQNKKAYFNYEIIEKIEAGIELLGFEVKSLRGSRGSLDGSYITVSGTDVFLVGAHIPPYQPIAPGDFCLPKKRSRAWLDLKKRRD